MSILVALYIIVGCVFVGVMMNGSPRPTLFKNVITIVGWPLILAMAVGMWIGEKR